MNPESPTISRNARWLLSIFAVLHIAAVFAEPFRFFSASPVKPASEEAGWLRSTLGRYVDFMYLSHGYAFFAPNPGPSHLLECEIKNPSNILNAAIAAKSKPTSGTLRDLPVVAPPEESFSAKAVRWRVFPDRNCDRPRLLYHRYFMLSEFYQTLFAPASLSEEELRDLALKDRWQFDRDLYESLQASISKRLRNTYEAESIKLRRIEHELPSQLRVLGDGWKLTDPRLYLELEEGEKAP
jgi:hypothetical protein